MNLKSKFVRILALMALVTFASSCGWFMRWKKPGRHKRGSLVSQTVPSSSRF